MRICALVVAAFATTPAAADSDNGDSWSKGLNIRLRGIAVLPNDSADISVIGGDIDIDNAYVPELDLSWFFTENIATELVLATTKHDARAVNTAIGNVDVGEFWLLPPTLLLQYHLPLAGGLKPYVGAGINYTIVYNQDAAGGTVTDLDIDNGFGYALQIGVDYFIDESWHVNFDVKRLWLNLDGELNNGAIAADIDVDPWIVGLGVGYRF
jgi:outer membrane protein